MISVSNVQRLTKDDAGGKKKPILSPIFFIPNDIDGRR